MTAHHLIVGLVLAQRLAELIHARRNTRRLLDEGAHEVGAGHYPLLVLLHGAWLAALAFAVPPDADVNLPLLGLFLVLQAGRFWVMASLGSRWTTRIIVTRGVTPVQGGPYRYLRHPNYWVVAGEIAVLPLVFGAWEIAAVFSALNAGLLVHRIRVEEAALAAGALD